MIVVPIVAACGLTIPKTSSRAITSPAGTADAMETIAPVDLDLTHMRRVVEPGGFTVWVGTSSEATLEGHFTVTGGVTVLSQAPPRFR